MSGIFVPNAARHLAGLGLTMAATALLAVPAHAAVIQTVSVSFDPTPEQIGNGDTITNVQRTTNLNGPIVDPIFANIVGNGFMARGSVGPFGNLGFEGSTIRTGEMQAQVDIDSDEFINPFATAREARINFIIDGGNFNFIAGPGSSMRFVLTVDSTATHGPVFQTGFLISTSGGNALDTSFELIGEDIGIVNPTPTTVEIPLSFVSASLGLIQPNQQFDIEYQASLSTEVDGFAEVVNFAFSDPFDVSGFGEFPTVEFSDPAVVPLPAAAPLLLGAMGLLGLLGRFLRRGRSGGLQDAC